jgi:cell shape-determining protein MreC
MSEIKAIAEALKKKQEVIKDLKEQNEDANNIKAQIKELQEELKALFAADEELVSLEEDAKQLTKELKEAAKFIAKGKSFKPALVVAYAKTSVKGDEAVSKVTEKGNAFAFLDSQTI